MNQLGWPLTLSRGDLRLRPLSVRDEDAWRRVKAVNTEWLAPWEASLPGAESRPAWSTYVRGARKDARRGLGLPLVIEHQGQFAGQLTLGNVVWSSLRSGYLGYWVDGRLAGRGIMTTAVAMLTDHLLAPGRLHRVEINIRPENTASLRVVEKLGYRFEGTRLAYLHISGQWRDHHSFAMTAAELPAGGLAAQRPLQH